MKKYKKRIKEKGIKIYWIAEQLGVSQPSLSMYLSEKRQMPLEVENKLKKLLLWN